MHGPSMSSFVDALHHAPSGNHIFAVLMPSTAGSVMGGYEYVVAKHVFVFEGVSLVVFGVIVVEGTAERHAGVVGFARHGVDVGEKGVAEFHGLTHGGEVGEFPDLAFDAVVFGGMGAENRGENAGLYPAEQELGVVDVLPVVRLVASDIVSPIAVAHV